MGRILRLLAGELDVPRESLGDALKDAAGHRCEPVAACPECRTLRVVWPKRGARYECPTCGFSTTDGDRLVHGFFIGEVGSDFS